ncbi:MAG TPA: hypothetical protein VNK23_14485 [Candidatus Dormibacteraeota bacterium]|nr:hypothetical protein [Candidatus Dormibacteraeota bacterium]
MWQFLLAHRADAELIGVCWIAVQIAAGMPTPRDASNTAYKWAFNVAHSFTNLPRLLATAFPEVNWVAALFGVPASDPGVRPASTTKGQITGGGPAK